MRLVVQRVRDAWLQIEDEETPPAGPGLLALVGFHRDDGEALLEPMANKLVHLRIFDDGEGRMNRSLLDTGGKLSLVSQFTLYADCRKGRRPSFVHALAPERAEPLYDRFVEICAARVPVATSGSFGAHMTVHLINEGPVTILLDSRELKLHIDRPGT